MCIWAIVLRKGRDPVSLFAPFLQLAMLPVVRKKTEICIVPVPLSRLQALGKGDISGQGNSTGKKQLNSYFPAPWPQSRLPLSPWSFLRNQITCLEFQIQNSSVGSPDKRTVCQIIWFHQKAVIKCCYSSCHLSPVLAHLRTVP